MNNVEQPDLPPSYKEILPRIGLELKNRKSDLAWRTAIIIIPLGLSCGHLMMVQCPNTVAE